MSAAPQLRIASAVAAVAAGLPVMLPIARDLAAVSPRQTAWLAAFLVFLGLFWLLTSRWCGRLPRVLSLGLLGAATTSGLALAWLGQTAFGGVYAVLIAPLLLPMLPPGRSAFWLAIQTIALGFAFAFGGFSVTDTLLLLLVFGSLEFFAFHSARVAASEREARNALEDANADLLTARKLLSESVRANERLFIARELHDLLGHHLTALSLALEAAVHSDGPAAAEHVGRARVLVKRLFLELRRSVSTLRDESPVELESAIRQLAASATKPKVHIDVQSDLSLPSPMRARAVLRCAQEVVTNALRHSDADNLWLVFGGDAESVHLRGHDDGRGAAVPKARHGLLGMKERVAELGGDATWSSAPGQGFTVDVRIPLREDAR